VKDDQTIHIHGNGFGAWCCCFTLVAQPSEQYGYEGNLVSGVVLTSTGDARPKEVAEYATVHVKSWLSDPLIVKMINARNAERAPPSLAWSGPIPFVDVLQTCWAMSSRRQLCVRGRNQTPAFDRVCKLQPTMFNFAPI
jgi:hypothetical protein